MAGSLKWEPPKLDLSVDRYNAFELWYQRWTDYAVVTKLAAEEETYKCSMLRYSFTEDTRKIYESLQLTDAEKLNSATIIEKLKEFAKGTVNETLERHTFNSRYQQEGELFDDFLTDIKTLSKNCNFCVTCHDGLIRDRIVQGIRDSSVRQKLLSEEKLALKKAEEICRAREKANQGLKQLKRNTAVEENEIARLSHHMHNTRFDSRGGARRRNNNYSNTPPTNNSSPRNQEPRPCKFCVGIHQWGRQFCSAWQNRCTDCNQLNHSKGSVLCKKRLVNNVNDNKDSNYEDDDDVNFLFLDSIEEEDETNHEESNDSQMEQVKPVSIDNPTLANNTLPSENSNKKKGKRKKKAKKKKRAGITHVEEPLAKETDSSIADEMSEESDSTILNVGSATENGIIDTMSWEIHMPAKNGVIYFKVDSGADVTVIPPEDLPKLGLTKADIHMTRKKLYGPSKRRMKCLGFVTTKFRWGDTTGEQLIYVCEGLKRPLLGKPEIRKFKILTFNETDKFSCAAVQDFDTIDNGQGDNPEEYDIVKEFPTIHGRLGKINVGEDVTIRMKQGITPHQTTAPRHIPIPLREKVIRELEKMVKMGVIKKIDNPTEWCHPIVIVSKPDGSIRLCIDLTKLNAGVERELYQLESVEETIGKLGDECVFMTKVDANSGYWQVPLDKASQELTTFITPIGRFCCTRGPYGLSSMQEIFSKKMDIVIAGLVGIVKSTDDFMIHAKTREILRERTRELFKRFEKHGVTINLKKCEFEKTEMNFIGHKINKDGIQPLESKMAAIEAFAEPRDITELRRFLGMANQMAKFNPNLSEASAPLRDLLSTKNDFVWQPAHAEAFKQVKKVIMSPEVLKLYDVNRPTKIRCDGSRLNGIAVILYQKHGDRWYPVNCASRYLKESEKRWYPIENEMLAITWGCEKMNLYLQGLPHFLIETDHNPLVPILNNKSLVDMSPRIQEMRMKLLKYSFTAKHVKGKDMEDADALSRAPHEKPSEKDTIRVNEVEAFVSQVVKSMPVTTPYFEKIKKHTLKDMELQNVMKTMKNGWPHSRKECKKEVQPYWASRHDLAVISDVLVKGDRIVIPKSLRKDVLSKLHNAHQGMSRSKHRARQTCYWPTMNMEIEKMIQKCNECLHYKPSKKVEELHPHTVPTRPWQKVGTDLFELGGNDYVLVTDYYSLYPELYKLKHATSQCVIETLKDSFARHGIPDELVSDNGSQYKSYKFNNFAREWEFNHTTSSPRYPKSNGLAESSVKTVKNMMKKCLASNLDVKKALLSIRNTPLSCGRSPAELLMNRTLRDNMPRLPTLTNTKTAGSRDLMAERNKQKQQHDKHIHQQAHINKEFLPGQHVAIQDHVTKEWSIRGKIIQEVAPRSFDILVNNKNTLRRNQRHMRKIHSTTSYMPSQQGSEIDSDEEYSSDTETIPYDMDDQEFPLADEDMLDNFEQESDEEFQVLNPDSALQNNTTTRSGRTVKLKHPTDYDDL